MKKIKQKSFFFFLAIFMFSNVGFSQVFPLDFEDANITYEIFGFGDVEFNAIPAEIIANPDMTGLNTSATVAHIQKTEGAQVWAGASIPLAAAIDLSGGGVFEIKVWSPRAGVPINLKVEDTTSPPDGNGNPSIIAEVIATTTMANAWEILIFDLTTHAGYDAANMYNQAVTFPDFGNIGVAGGESFYFDDFQAMGTSSNNDLRGLNTNFKAFPNPVTSGITTVSLESPISAQASIQIVNALGQKIQETNLGNLNVGQHTQDLDLSELANGIYYFALIMDGQFVSNEKIILLNN